jgi:HAD superfamily hydrolase (TIGR01490 family)
VSPPLPDQRPAGIALFDLDGTLIPWDCQLLFRHYVVRREPWRAAFLPVFLGLLPLGGVIGVEGLKRVFLSYLWRLDEETLRRYACEFATQVAAAAYPELLAKLEEHRRRGHFLILSSASPEFYVAEIGRQLGFDLVLGTEVDATIRRRFFPDLENHKGAAKVRRLHQRLPASFFENGRLVACHGYTDSTADLPMLELCESATVVNPSPRLAALAAEAGWEVVRPQRPWTSRSGFARRAAALLAGLGRDPGGLTARPRDHAS